MAMGVTQSTTKAFMPSIKHNALFWLEGRDPETGMRITFAFDLFVLGKDFGVELLETEA